MAYMEWNQLKVNVKVKLKTHRNRSLNKAAISILKLIWYKLITSLTPC